MGSNTLRVLASPVLCLSFMLALIVGCSDDKPTIVPVTGKVTLNGGQLPGPAVISFRSKETEFGAKYSVNPDGTFTLGSEWGAGIPPGSYMVAIRPPLPDPRASKEARGPADTSYIPKKYRRPHTSGFEVVVTETGGGPFEFDMKK